MSDAVNGNKYAPVPGKIPGVSINLGGHDLIVAPLSLDQVQALDSQIQELNSVDGMKLAEAVGKGLPVMLAAVQRNYPDMTEDSLRPLIDLGNFKELINIIIDSSGYKRVSPSGESKPAGR